MMREPWPRVWMKIAHDIADMRSPDPRLKVGAIIVASDNTSILSLGYNGGVRGGSNEPESLEPGKSGFTHAEVNCLIKAPYHYSVSKHLYVTHSPCQECARAICNGNIECVIYDIAYRDTSGIEILRNAGVSVSSLEELFSVPF